MWIQGLDLLRKPLLHLHTQANVETSLGGHRLRLHELNQAPRRPGIRLIQSRPGIPRQNGGGPRVPNPEVTQPGGGVWQRASAGWAAVRTLKTDPLWG